MFRLQSELVTLQEWTRATGARIVVIFEGRDAAGKGGTIKRITEYLNPRVTRIAALPTPTERERDPVVLPALHRASAGRRRDRAVRPLLVQPRRRRAGDGLLHAGTSTSRSCTRRRSSSRCCRRRDPAAQVLVLGLRRRAGEALPVPARRSDAAVEAVPDGPGVHQPLGGLLPGQGRDVRAHRHPRAARGSWSSPTSRSTPG